MRSNFRWNSILNTAPGNYLCCTKAISAAVFFTTIFFQSTFLVPVVQASDTEKSVAAADDADSLAPSEMSFSEMRNAVVSKISAARSRVWLTTDYLTDGDVAAALHLAKYRKLDVKVLLGRRKVNAYMSRVRFLKEQGITTILRPQSFPTGTGSAILSDNHLHIINGDLDFRSNQQNFKIETATPEMTRQYIAAFEQAAAGTPEVRATPQPNVGKPRPNQPGRLAPYSPGNKRQRSVDSSTPAAPKSTQSEGANGIYHYTNRRNSRPEGIPNRLPKVLKWKEIERQRNRQQPPNGR